MKTDFRASVPVHNPGCSDAVSADSPTAGRGLLALVFPRPGHLSQLSQTRLGQAGLAHSRPRTALGQGAARNLVSQAYVSTLVSSAFQTPLSHGALCSHVVRSPVPALKDYPLQHP